MDRQEPYTDYELAQMRANEDLYYELKEKQMRTILREITWVGSMETGWGNGYVVLPKGHKYHGKHYDDIDVDIHGGLTFSEEVNEEILEHWGSLLTKEDIGCWIIGFDCAHYGDNLITCPKEYVQAEADRLLEQCK